MKDYSIYTAYEKVMYPLSDDAICEKENDWLYVFYNNTTRLTKIGITSSPYRRFGQIRTSSGSDLTFLISIEMEVGRDERAIVLERYLHNHFSSKRVVGEWFKLDVRDLLIIEDFLWSIEGNYIIDDYRSRRLKSKL